MQLTRCCTLKVFESFSSGRFLIQFTAVLAFVLSLFSAPVYAQQKIVISTFENSGIDSIYLPILEEVYQALDIELEVKYSPPQRSLYEANIGRVDGEAARLTAIEKNVNNLVRIPTPLGSIDTHVFSKLSDIEIKDWEGLRPYKVIVLLGYKRAEKMSRSIQRIFAHSPAQAMELLGKGKADFAVLPLLDGLKALKKSPFGDIKPSSRAIESNNLYHYLHKKNSHLVAKIDKLLMNMKAKGGLEKYRKIAVNN